MRGIEAKEIDTPCDFEAWEPKVLGSLLPKLWSQSLCSLWCTFVEDKVNAELIGSRSIV